jgi:hypothetical protein
MKTLGIVCFAVLLASSCRKAALPPASEATPAPAVETAAAPASIRVPAPVSSDKDALAENQRTRPNPRPADVKRRPAPEYKYPVAQAVPGKAGFVFSPYSNKVIDVRDIPAGTLVRDPTYTGEEKGYLRVP